MPADLRDVPFSDLRGQWIWQTAAGPADTWLCLRRGIDLPAAPISGTARCRIAVDSKYWLYVNGALVVREGALKRGPTPQDTWCDELDLAPWLVAGRNQLAVLVWHWGKSGLSHRDSGQGGLLFDADLAGTPLVSDGAWRVRPHPAFGHAADPQPNWRLPEHHVRYDARSDLGEWTTAAYDDRGWAPATCKGAAGAAPWGRLWPRTVPQWQDAQVAAYVDAPALPLRSTGGTITATLPYNAQFTPWFDLEAAAGLVITVRTDHYCGGGNGQDFNVRAEYVTRAGRQRFEAPGWMNGHAVHHDIPDGVTVHGLGWRETGYASAFTGDFTCDDDFCTTLWRKARRTLYVTMRDTYVDCPDRERAQWWGDAVIELEEAFYALDRRADALARKGILDLVRWQKPGGALFSPVPGNWEKELPPQMLASIGLGFGTYLLHSGDDSFVAEAYPHIARYLALWRLDAQGLVEHRTGEWDWGDWGQRVDARLLDAIWLHSALEHACAFARIAGADQDVPGYRAQLATVAAALQAHCWTAEGYRSPGWSGPSDDRGNALAVVAGLATPEQYATIAGVLQTTLAASPYMEKYVLQALFLMDRDTQAFARMRSRYAPMVESPLSTLWEFWTTGGWGSANHAWAGGPLTLLSQCAVGIVPTSPGYRTFRIHPRPGPLQRLAVRVDSVAGMIAVKIQRDGRGLKLEATVPAAASAVIALAPSLGAIGSVTLNGMGFGAEPRADGATLVAGAEPLVEVAVGPGEWVVEAVFAER